jgi:hypothetical protein
MGRPIKSWEKTHSTVVSSRNPTVRRQFESKYRMGDIFSVEWDKWLRLPDQTVLYLRLRRKRRLVRALSLIFHWSFWLTDDSKWHLKHEKKTMESCTRVYVDDSHGWGYTPTNIKMAPPHCADWTPNIEKKRLNQQRRASLRWPYPNLMSKHRRGC